MREASGFGDRVKNSEFVPVHQTCFRCDTWRSDATLRDIEPWTQPGSPVVIQGP
jgi:hypothetical protein